MAKKKESENDYLTDLAFVFGITKEEAFELLKTTKTEFEEIEAETRKETKKGNKKGE